MMQNSIPKSYNEGIGNFFQALMGGGGQKAYDSEYDKLLNRDLTRAQIGNYQSQAQERRLRQNALEAMPGALAGLSDMQASQLGDYMTQGRWENPEEMAGPLRSGEQRPWVMNNQPPDWATPEVIGRYQDANRLKSMIGAATSSNPVQNMQALGLGDMMAGRLNPESAAAMFAASQGKPVFNQGTQGILNQYTGANSGTPKTAAEAQASLALAAERMAGADKNAAEAQVAGQGRPGATQALIQYYMGHGLTFDEAQTLANGAKWNPQAEAVKTAGTLLKEGGRIGGQRVTPELAQQTAIDLVRGIQEVMGGVSAPQPANAPDQAVMPQLSTPQGQAAITSEIGAMEDAVFPTEMPPPAALGILRPGVMTQFANGQVWTIENGRPKRVQ